MGTFVNFSNHPSRGWSELQRNAAEEYGTIIDIPFPAMTKKIIGVQPDAVMCMGEFVLCFKIVQKLKAKGICVLASCSERKAVEHMEKDGTIRKESIFAFCRFREY